MLVMTKNRVTGSRRSSPLSVNPMAPAEDAEDALAPDGDRRLNGIAGASAYREGPRGGLRDDRQSEVGLDPSRLRGGNVQRDVRQRAREYELDDEKLPAAPRVAICPVLMAGLQWPPETCPLPNAITINTHRWQAVPAPPAPCIGLVAAQTVHTRQKVPTNSATSRAPRGGVGSWSGRLVVTGGGLRIRCVADELSARPRRRMPRRPDRRRSGRS